MSYASAKQAYDEQANTTQPVRTDYRCKAHGCPNAGSIEDLCYWHWKQKESPEIWHEITQRIRENFNEMRNWGEFSSELQSKHYAESQARWQKLRERA